MAKYENPAELDYRNGGDTVDDFAQKYMRTVDYIIKALNDLRTPTGNTAGVEPEPYMWRIADNKLYIRNADNTDYVLLGEISPNFGFRQSVNDRFLTTADLEGDGAVVTRNEAGKVEGDITGSPGKIAGKTIDVTPTADNDVIAYDAAQQKWVKKTLNDYLKKQGDAGWDEMVDEVADQVIEDITPIIFNFWYLDDDGYLVPLVGSTEGGMPSIHGMVGDYEQITARSVDVAGNLSATGNVTAGMVTTPQANITTLTANAVNAGTITADDIIAKGPIVDVRAFGAKGDGVTDDTAAIQEALNKNAKVCFPPGSYKITGLLKIPTGVVTEFIGNAHFDIGSFDTSTQTGGWVYYDNPTYHILPEWFGAVGDGVTDDKKALQNCIDSLLNPEKFPIGKTQAEAGEGHPALYNKVTVYLSKRYHVSDFVEIRAEAHFNALSIISDKKGGLIGDGSASIANYTNKAIVISKPDDYPSSDTDTQTRKDIKGLFINYFKYGIYDEGTDLECSFANNVFEDITISAIRLNNSDGTLVFNNYGCWIYGYLVSLSYSNRCRIIGNQIGEGSNNAELISKGIQVNQGTVAPNIIANNIFRHCGIAVGNRTCGDIIIGNEFDNASVGVECTGATKNVSISNNVFSNCVTSCKFTGSQQKCNDNIFIECTTGVNLGNNGNEHSITNNTFTNCTSGILSGVSMRNKISGNTFKSCDKGIDSSGYGGGYSYVFDNSFISCTTNYVFLSPSSYPPVIGYNYISNGSVGSIEKGSGIPS